MPPTALRRLPAVLALVLAVLAPACDRRQEGPGRPPVDAGTTGAAEDALGPNAVALGFSEAMADRDPDGLARLSAGRLETFFADLAVLKRHQLRLGAAIRKAVPDEADRHTIATMESLWQTVFDAMFRAFELDGFLREDGGRRIYQVTYVDSVGRQVYNELTLERVDGAWRVTALEDEHLKPEIMEAVAAPARSIGGTVDEVVARFEADPPASLTAALRVVDEVNKARTEGAATPGAGAAPAPGGEPR